MLAFVEQVGVHVRIEAHSQLSVVRVSSVASMTADIVSSSRLSNIVCNSHELIVDFAESPFEMREQK